ncbi:MAG TPA: alanine/ornithine racemase family PLP-dependent enzyme [Thermotogota bacterium]|mgnify:CR=1 FL=1|nr:alanine/ornithine racemase family PLP-dependent enzyme [Thermotogota bacterium]HRW91583.1 alanine/ornithine racemase family PLP-dependent enzyme [Thermotogota bacterium]
MFPELHVNTNAIASNAQVLRERCKRVGVDVAAVTKVVCADLTISQALVQSGVTMLADSRLQNLRKLQAAGWDVPLLLLRVPMLGEIPQLVDTADLVLVSELRSVQEILGAKGRKKPGMLYMVDVGDLREGVWIEQAYDEIARAQQMAQERLVGVGTNLGCFGGVLPDVQNMGKIVELARAFSLPIVSGGNTAALYLVENQSLPQGVNHFRLGESIMLGTDVTGNRQVPGTRQDTFRLVAQVVEAKQKPSVPRGTIGQDAFGRVPHFVDKGWRKKAILAVGEQDIQPDGLIPLQEGIEVLHASSDHTIIDVTRCPEEICVGDTVAFGLTYGALLRAMTSEYVQKKFVV